MISAGYYNPLPIVSSSANPTPVQLDVTGAQYVNTEGRKVSYTWANNQSSFAAAPNEILILGGSSTKVVRVVRFEIVALATAAISQLLILLRRNVASSAGTTIGGLPIPTPTDSQYPASTATVNLYTANPTVNDPVTNRFIKVWAQPFGIVTAATSVINSRNIFSFGDNGTGHLVLHGPQEQFCLTAGAAALPAGSVLYYSLEWTEE